MRPVSKLKIARQRNKPSAIQSAGSRWASDINDRCPDHQRRRDKFTNKFWRELSQKRLSPQVQLPRLA
jgi:hypothetical protein